MKTSHTLRSFKYFYLGFMLFSCSDNFLDTTPTAVNSNKVLANEDGINSVLIAAYSALDGSGLQTNGWFGTWAWASSVSNWVWGSVASDDGTKGSDITDSSPVVPIEDYTADPSNGYVSDKWNGNYEAVSRCNDVLRLTDRAVNVPQEKLNEFRAQALFLRAWFHFELKRVFNNIPYITEYVNPAKVSNKSDAWPMLEADMKFAVENLPVSQAQPGRPTKYAAEAVLARIYLFEHKYAEAKLLLDDIINSGKYSLMPNYDDNYLIAKRNNAESIFEIQYAVNDGTMESANGGYGDALNFPQNVDGTGTCCGFHQPTQNLVNAFKTDAVTGLPLLDTFNDSNFKNDMGLYSEDIFVPDTIQTIDPRLDFSIGRRGIPYLDWGIMRGHNWIRDQGNGGPYVYKKNMFLKSEKNIYSTTTGWATGVNANNYRAYRLAHILLWRAEVAIEEGDLTTAVNLVNQVRRRAANHVVMGRCYSYLLPASADQHFLVDYSKPAANYLVKEYPEFPNADYARKAVRHELRLEFGMEGHRHFDLVRWGIAAETINAYMEKDREFRYLFGGASPKRFVEGKNEYWPIPTTQIDLEGEDVLVQNPGY
jgi:starch-binding outer membrane protein, SusD/RagB family